MGLRYGKKEYICIVMAISRLLQKAYLLLAVFGMGVAETMSAQVLSVLNSFSNRTFNGTVNVSWPVLFDHCTFVTDSIVLNHSYGAVFRNCRFESGNSVLYLAGSGDGMILSDCDVNGCGCVRFSLQQSMCDRNYIQNVTVNGLEWLVPDDQESITDIEGLELGQSVQGLPSGPMLMLVSADKTTLKTGDASNLRIRGLEKGMFVGWHSADSAVVLSVDDDFCCSVRAIQKVTQRKDVLITAYTEYGLEAACMLTIIPDDPVVADKGKKNKKDKPSRRKKRK